MKVVRFDDLPSDAIAQFNSSDCRSTELASNDGAGHAYTIAFEAGGQIGFHRAGFDQLFVPVSGSGWVQVEGGDRLPVRCGEAAVFVAGEMHAKGSDTGMRVLMVQFKQAHVAV